jgi:glycosyltransferase involved in cell wall biosynthesis
MEAALRLTLASAHDRTGGAAVAASRLRDGLRGLGHDARLFVQTQSLPHPATVGPQGAGQRSFSRVRSGLDSLPVRRAGGSPEKFSASWLPRRWPSMAAAGTADVTHLHWTNAGFLSVADVGALRMPVVWTLHDMWAFTGGCQYDEGCGRHAEGCGNCPLLQQRGPGDLSARRHAAKQRHWQGLDLTVIAPSRWMAAEARRSRLFASRRIEVLANGLDLQRYKPLDRAFARHALGLPADRRLVLFGALNPGSDRRKGYDLLQEALARLAAQPGQQPSLALVVFGSNPPRQETLHGLPAYHFGHLHDDVALALLYAACDVFVAPSRQENLPNTVAEALACGVPCVAFDIGGMPDLIKHQHHGWLAKPFDTADLAAGIAWCLEDSAGRWHALCERARRFAEDELALERQAQRHVDLYRQLLTAPRSPA